MLQGPTAHALGFFHSFSLQLFNNLPLTSAERGQHESFSYCDGLLFLRGHCIEIIS